MVGAIDIGSNSVRLILRDKGRTVFKDNIITQLALGMEGELLDFASVKRTASAVAFFVNKAKEAGAEKIFAFGTCALRKAKNSGDFIDLVKSETGITVEIIGGDKEAELGLKGVLNGEDGGIIDIGGASTEIIISEGRKVTYSKSLNVGVVELKNRCGQDRLLLEKFSEDAVKLYGDLPRQKMFGIGGTVTSVACLLQDLPKYDCEKVDGYVVTKGKLRALSDRLFSMTEEERKNIPSIQPKRAEVIAGGAVWLLKIMDYLNIEEVTASEKDNLEGFLIDRGLYE